MITNFNIFLNEQLEFKFFKKDLKKPERKGVQKFKIIGKNKRASFMNYIYSLDIEYEDGTKDVLEYLLPDVYDKVKIGMTLIAEL